MSRRSGDWAVAVLHIFILRIFLFSSSVLTMYRATEAVTLVTREMLVLSFCFLYGPRAFAMLASTHTRVFQVWKSARPELVDGGQLATQKVFQVCFNQFQVRVRSAWDNGGCVRGAAKRPRNG